MLTSDREFLAFLPLAPDILERKTIMLRGFLRDAGVLCREFLSAHLCPSTPVIMSGSGEAIIPGGLLYEEPNLKPSPNSTKNGLGDTGSGALVAGEAAVATCGCETAPAGDGKHTGAATPAAANPSSSSSSCDARILAASAEKGKGDGRAELGRNEGDAPVPVDVSTVGELYPWKNMYGVTERGGQLELGFLVQQVMPEPLVVFDLRWWLHLQSGECIPRWFRFCHFSGLRLSRCL